MTVRTKARENRSRMPATAREVDAFRAKFGAGVRVLYAQEGDQEIGTQPDHGRSMSGARWIHFLETGLLP